MKKEFLIESLNAQSADVLTLEKAEDRVEFEALIALGTTHQADGDLTCSCYDSQKCWDWW